VAIIKNKHHSLHQTAQNLNMRKKCLKKINEVVKWSPWGKLFILKVDVLKCNRLGRASDMPLALHFRIHPLHDGVTDNNDYNNNNERKKRRD